jgi:hypothetical protein
MAALGIFVHAELKQRYKRLQLIAEKINILPAVALLLSFMQSPDQSIRTVP